MSRDVPSFNGISSQNPVVSILGAHLCPLLPMDRRELTDTLTTMAQLALQPQKVTGGVELVLVRDIEMARCNTDHMGLPGPTNVLSFPSDSPDMPACLVLSVDTLLREAHLYKQPVRAHLLRLLAHALAHAAGYDHGNAMDVFCDNILKMHRK